MTDARALIVIPAKSDRREGPVVIPAKSDRREGPIVIPAKAGIHCAAAALALPANVLQVRTEEKS